MTGLPEGCLSVEIQYRRVTDIQPASQPASKPSFDSKDRAYALRRAGNKKLS